MSEQRKTYVLSLAFCALIFALPVRADVTTAVGGGKSVTPDDLEIQIKGQFKGRLMIKRIVAPVSMNLEKLQDFPEDPAQKILLEPLPISQSADFNARNEIKGHLAFCPVDSGTGRTSFLAVDPAQNRSESAAGSVLDVRSV